TNETQLAQRGWLVQGHGYMCREHRHADIGTKRPSDEACRGSGSSDGLAENERAVVQIALHVLGLRPRVAGKEVGERTLSVNVVATSRKIQTVHHPVVITI